MTDQSDIATDVPPAALILPAKPDMAAAVQLASDLSQRAGAEIILDAEGVEDMTTPMVTAILSAIRHRSAEAPAIAVSKPSPAFIDAFSDLGAFSDLMKMEFRQ